MNRIEEIATHLKQSQVLIITAGAGMGVDSGLPDFRGDQGFWKAYPMYQKLNLSFMEAANPRHFARDPAFGWGFYGHRLNLYRQTQPHLGFQQLLTWIQRFGLSYFVVTSNVDGQFQKAGFPEERLLEVHGSIHFLQCTQPCSEKIWPNGENILVEESTMRAQNLPHCPHCGQVARPNILMFGDDSWNPQRTARQEATFRRFLAEHREQTTLVIEIGAGTAVPTIRYLTEDLGQAPHTRCLRLNPREPWIEAPHVGLPMGGVEGLTQLEGLL